MLKDILEKKLLWVFEGEFNKNPETFIERISEKIQNKSPNSLEPFSKQQTLTHKVIFDSDNKWKDCDEVFEFLALKGYDFLGQKVEFFSSHEDKNQNLISKHNKKSELVSFIKLLKNGSSNLEQKICDYLKDKDPATVLKVFEDSGENLYTYINEYQLNKLKEILPKLSSSEQAKNLLSVFSQNMIYNQKNTITKEQLQELSQEDRKWFIDGVLKEVDKNLLNSQLIKTQDYKMKTIRSFLVDVKAELNATEKSRFLKRIPQKYYYKEVANAIGMRFTNKEFVGNPWDRLIDFGIYNRNIENEKGHQAYLGTRVSFEIDNAWITDVLSIRDKIQEKPYREKDFYFAFASLITYINNSDYFYSPPGKDDLECFQNGRSFNIRKFHSLFYGTPEMNSYMVDEFNNNLAFRNSFLEKKVFVENFDELLPQLNKKLLLETTLRSNLLSGKNVMVNEICFLYKKNVGVVDYFKGFDVERQKEILNEFCNSYRNSLDHPLEVSSLNDFISSFGKEIVQSIEIKPENTNLVKEEMKVLLNKIKLDFSMEENIKNKENDIETSTSFKL